jgi:hypothetical protein
LTSTLDGSEWSASRPCHFKSGTHWTGSWVNTRTGSDNVVRRKILPPFCLPYAGSPGNIGKCCERGYQQEEWQGSTRQLGRTSTAQVRFTAVLTTKLSAE